VDAAGDRGAVGLFSGSQEAAEQPAPPTTREPLTLRLYMGTVGPDRDLFSGSQERGKGGMPSGVSPRREARDP